MKTILDLLPKARSFSLSGSGGGVGLRGRLRTNGSQFVDADGAIFRPVFASALLGLSPNKSDEEVREFLDWVAATGFNGVRVFAGALRWEGLTVDRSRQRLPWFLGEAAARGLYVEVVALTDSRNNGTHFDYEVTPHVAAIANICADFDHTLLEIANEPQHGTQSDAVHDESILNSLGHVPRGRVTYTLGNANGDTPDEVERRIGDGDYMVFHLERSTHDLWNMARKVKDMGDISRGMRRPVLNNEPIGAAEPGTPGQRIQDVDVFFGMGATDRVCEVGGVFHFEAGLRIVMPGPVQRACAEAFVAGSNVIPTTERLSFYNTGWAHSPVVNARFTDEGGHVIRIYTGVAGDRAWSVVLGLTGDPEAEFGNGWYFSRVVAERPGMAVWELKR